MKKLFFLLFIFAFAAFAEKAKPLDVALSENFSTSGLFINVNYSIAPGYHIYADMMSVAVSSNAEISPVSAPAPVNIYDPLSEEKRKMYTNDFTVKYLLKIKSAPVKITLNYQGCSEKICFMPVSKEVEISGKYGANDKKRRLSKTTETLGQSTKNVDSGEKNEWRNLSAKFKIAGKKSGYLNAKDFLAFLSAAESGKSADEETAADKFINRGILLSLILIILGGIALNLTPCVLPMIPINLAIIGAGAQSSSKAKGFLLGGIYGLGIALTYGALGLAVVLSGSQFGALNSSPWFNFCIAVIFVVLALAMFDIIMIDFTKYQHSATEGKIKKGTFFTAFFMGCVAALLAGACVAPVVIYVLLLSASMYAKGIFIALFLPFLLGLGMGLPWPFAGAGLSFLPKPGVWMTRVKYIFGVLIILFAVYYGHLGYSLLSSHTEAGFSGKNPEKQFTENLKKALNENKPVIIDFWATWCKNCTAMENSTFKNKKVIDRLKQYVFIKIQAEHPDKEPIKSILKQYEVLGLPTYVILHPIKK